MYIGRFGAGKFQGVTNQILEHVPNLISVSHDDRQWAVRNGCSRSLNRRVELGDHIFHKRLAIDRFQPSFAA